MSNKHNRRISECTSKIKSHFDCVICANTYDGTNPAKALPCLHTYCAKCLNRMADKGCIECPECRQVHVIPKGGTSNFNTNYFVMQLIDEIQEIDSNNDSARDSESTSASSTNRTAEHALCDIAIYSVEKLHNEVRDIRRQIDSQYENVIESVNEAKEVYTNSVTSTIASAQKRLLEIQQSVNSELEEKTANELGRVESQRAQQNNVFENVAQFCESKLQSLQLTGSLQGVEWDQLIEELEGQEKLLTTESRTQQKVAYKIVAMPRAIPDISAVIQSIEELQIINEKEVETNVVVKKGNGIATMPNQSRSQSIKKLVRQSRLFSEQTHDRSGNIKRNRGNDKENVVIKPQLKFAFSEDTPSSIPRVFLPPSPRHDAVQTCAIPEARGETNPNPHQMNVNCFAIQSTGASRHPREKPPLPVRKPTNQGLQQVTENHEVQSGIKKLPKQESIAKVNVQVVPCDVIEMDNSNPLQPLGLVAIDAGKYAIASGNGFKIIENNSTCPVDITPRSCVRTRVPQIFTDVCRLQDGTFLCAVKNTKDILKFNGSGKPAGMMEILDMGNRLKNVVQPFGIACDKDGTVYISDRGSGSILVCNRNGVLRNVIGRKGPPKEQLQDPMYLALAQTTEALVYVTDCAKGEVVVYMTDGTFIRTLSGKQNKYRGHASTTADALSGPVGIAQTRDGQIVVSDRKLHKVSVLDPISGKLLKEFGSFGSSRGQFDTPMGVSVIGDNKLAICDSNNFRVQLFDWPLK